MVILNTTLFALSIIFLSRSASALIKTLTRLAIHFKMSEYSAAFILMAIGTSLPELTVGVGAAFAQNSVLTLGTVLGSNIANLTLIIGLPALLANGLRIESKIRNRDLYYMIILSMVPLLLLWDTTLSRADGAILILLFVLYLYRMINQREAYSKKLNHTKITHGLWYYLLLFAAEVGIMIASAYVLVETATGLATGIGIHIALVGAVIVALGTSLPELTFEMYAVRKRESGLALGNIMGSVLTNSCLVLGIAAIISPISIQHITVIGVLGLSWIAVATLFGWFLRSQYKLTAQEGVILVFMYALFLIANFATIQASLF